MATFPEVCFWELSYVNVPAVDLKSYSMNVANRTLLRRIFFCTNITGVRTTCTGFLDMTSQQAAVHHAPKTVSVAAETCAC